MFSRSSPQAVRPHDLGMNQHRALRKAGRAGGEHDLGNVSRPDRLGHVEDGCIAFAGCGGRGLRPVGPVRIARADPEPRLDGREVLPGQQARVVDAQKFADADHDRGARFPQDVGDLVALQARADRDGDGTEQRGRKPGFNPFQAVRQPDRDTIALFQPDGQKRRCGAEHALAKLIIGDRQLRTDHRLARAVPRGGCEKQLSDCRVRLIH